MIAVFLVVASILAVSFQVAAGRRRAIGARIAGKTHGGHDYGKNRLSKY